MKELEVVKHIREHGFVDTIEKFDLMYKDYGHKTILKYKQKFSDLSLPEVQESRGLILYNDLSVASLGFTKFFNYGESRQHPIDINSSSIFFKEDGTLIKMYWDKIASEWCVGTTGTANGEGEVNSHRGGLSKMTFKTLFMQTLLDTINIDLSSVSFYDAIDQMFTRGITYMFELTTPYNIVVAIQKKSKLKLLGARDCRPGENYLKEISLDDLDFPEIPKVREFTYQLNDSTLDNLKKELVHKDFNFEGYVVCDKDFNRVKIKSPEYLRLCYIKNGSKRHTMLDIIKENETDEYISTMPDVKDTLLELKRYYDEFVSKLDQIWYERFEGIKSRKDLAYHISVLLKEKPLYKVVTKYWYRKHNGDSELNAKDFLYEIHTKKLFLLLEQIKNEELSF